MLLVCLLQQLWKWYQQSLMLQPAAQMPAYTAHSSEHTVSNSRSQLWLSTQRQLVGQHTVGRLEPVGHTVDRLRKQRRDFAVRSPAAAPSTAHTVVDTVQQRRLRSLCQLLTGQAVWH